MGIHMIGRYQLIAAGFLIVSACGPVEKGSESSVTDGGDGVTISLLEPMSEPEWKANIYNGSGCSLNFKGSLIFLAADDHGGLAKASGSIRKLTTDAPPFDWDGGRYEDGDLIVEIRAPGPAETAQVTVTLGEQ